MWCVFCVWVWQVVVFRPAAQPDHPALCVCCLTQHFTTVVHHQLHMQHAPGTTSTHTTTYNTGTRECPAQPQQRSKRREAHTFFSLGRRDGGDTAPGFVLRALNTSFSEWWGCLPDVMASCRARMPRRLHIINKRNAANAVCWPPLSAATARQPGRCPHLLSHTPPPRLPCRVCQPKSRAAPRV